MPWPSCSLSRSVICVSHLCESEPGQPGMTRRSGAAVDVLQRLAVHGPDDQAVLAPSPCRSARRATASAWRIARQVQVGAVVGGVDGGRLEPGRLQHVGQRHAGPFRAARAAVGPLVAARLRREEGAAVAAAFQHHAVGLGLEALLELAQRDLERLVDLAVDGELPGVRVRGGSGIWPLLRMKNFDVGVVSSSSRCSGVSATSGLSPSTTRPASLPGKLQRLRALRRVPRRVLLGLLREAPPGSARPACWPRTRSARRPRRSWRRGPRRPGSRAATRPYGGRTRPRPPARDRRHRARRSSALSWPLLVSLGCCCGGGPAQLSLSSGSIMQQPPGTSTLQSGGPRWGLEFALGEAVFARAELAGDGDGRRRARACPRAPRRRSGCR